MKLLFTTILLAVIGTMRQPDTEVVYAIDKSKSTVHWTGYYLFSFGEHEGSINIQDGDLTINNGQLTGGKVIIDMSTIHTLDEEFKNEKEDVLANHLMSADFFEVDKYPTAVLEITEVKSLKDSQPNQPNVEVTGMLTMKGTRLPIKFPVMLSTNDNQVIAKARFKFDRTKWNVKYSSGKYFDDVGDGAISDAIGISFDIVATPKSH